MIEEKIERKNGQPGEAQQGSVVYEKPTLKSISTEYELNGIVGNCSMGQTDTAASSNKGTEL